MTDEKSKVVGLDADTHPRCFEVLDDIHAMFKGEKHMAVGIVVVDHMGPSLASGHLLLR